MSWEVTNLARKAAASGELRTGESYMLLLLADHVHPDTWECWPSQELLALETGQGMRTVERQIARLRELDVIRTENVYGAGRGRVGLKYRLNREVLERLADVGKARVEELKQSRRSGGTGGSRNREITRPANLAGKSENREITRPANLAGETTHPPITTDSPANRDFVHIEDRARTNPQESPVRQSVRLSGPVLATTTDDGPTTDDEPGDDLVREVHRGVDLLELMARVPAAGQLETGQVRAIVDVVLARASGQVRRPTAFVARSLAAEFEELVSVTWPRPVLGPTSAPEAPTPGSPSGPVREVRVGEPCQDPDVHVAAYGTKVLQDCPHCRLERRLAAQTRVEVGG